MKGKKFRRMETLTSCFAILHWVMFRVCLIIQNLWFVFGGKFSNIHHADVFLVSFCFFPFLGHVRIARSQAFFERKYLPINYEKEYFHSKLCLSFCLSRLMIKHTEMILMVQALRILENDDERMKSTKLLVLNILKINKNNFFFCRSEGRTNI